MEGWIKIHKKMLQWEWFTDVNVAHLFVYLLLAANYEDRQWRGMTIERGQLVTSRDHLAQATGLSVQQVRTALDKLERTGEITQKSTNKYRIVTICKYLNYQMVDDSEQPTNNQQSTNNQPTNNQQITTTEEYKNIRNKEYIVVDDDNARARTYEGNEIVSKSTEELWKEFREMLGSETEMSNSTIRYFKSKYNTDITREDLVSWIDTFQEQQRMNGINIDTVKNYRGHFSNWLRIQIEEKIKNNNHGRTYTDRQPHKLPETLRVDRPTDGLDVNF